MPEVTNADIMRELGVLATEVRHSAESRKVIHEKLDDQRDLVHTLDKKVDMIGKSAEVAAEVALQARNKFDAFERNFQINIEPAIKAGETFRLDTTPIVDQMRLVRNIILGLMGLGIVSVAGLMAAAALAGDMVKAGIRWYIGL